MHCPSASVVNLGGIGRLLRLAGRWEGISRLWEPTTEGARESRSTANVTSILEGSFVRIDYTWTFDGEPQEGSLLFGHEEKGDRLTVVWVDTWHMGDRVMVCRGTGTDGDALSVRGSYAAPPGPDWGWRTVIEPAGRDSFRMSMYNISPEGHEVLAVDAMYSRARPSRARPRARKPSARQGPSRT